MAFIRRVRRMSFMVVWQLVIWIVLIFNSYGDYWKLQQRFGRISVIWGKGLAWIFGIKIKINGDIGDFKGGLIVSNHTGYVDILVHAAVFPIRFAPKKSIANWPLLGWFLRTGRPIWIDRTSPRKAKNIAKQFKDSMDNGVNLLVYPEGTSTNGKDGILQFKSTPFAAAVENDNWILPTIIRYADTPDGKPIAWFGNMTFLPHLWRIMGYKEIFAEVTVMKPFKPEDLGRKELAVLAHDKMQKEYQRIIETAI